MKIPMRHDSVVKDAELLLMYVSRAANNEEIESAKCNLASAIRDSVKLTAVVIT